MLTSEKCIEEIKLAIRMFGEYTYYDKGAWEVMEPDDFIPVAEKMDPFELANVLEKVLDYEYGRKFAEDLVCALDTMPDEWWNKLMKNETIQDLY